MAAMAEDWEGEEVMALVLWEMISASRERKAAFREVETGAEGWAEISRWT